MADKDFRVPVFRRAIHGYSPEHVDAFIKVVQEKYCALIAENEKLRGRISSAAAESKKRGVEDELRRHEIEEIRDKAVSLLQEAKDRADRLVREAEAEADSIRADAACEREDAEIYAEEARTEALEMLKEREALLSRAKAVVAELREKLGEECGSALCALEELEGTAAAEDAAGPLPEDGSPEEEITEEEPDLTEPVPEEQIAEEESDLTEPEPEDAEETPDEDRIPEEESYEDDISIPDFSPVFEDEEEPEEGVIREGFPFAFDENDTYREDGGTEEEYEGGEDRTGEAEDEGDEEEDEGSEEEEDGEEYEEYEEEGEEEENGEDGFFAGSIPDYVSEYPEAEPSGLLEEENDLLPEDRYAEEPAEGPGYFEEGPEEESEEQEEPEEYEEPEEAEEEYGDGEEEREPEEEDGTGEYGTESPDYDPASSETYRDYDLDEILRGLEYMAAEKGEEAFGPTETLPDDEEDIVDALKKKFGDVSDEDPSDEDPSDGDGGEEDGDGASDFYEDEEHEDGESFDPNNYLRFKK